MDAFKTHAFVPYGDACVCNESCELPMSKSKTCPYCIQPGDTPVCVFDVQARITMRVRESCQLDRPRHNDNGRGKGEAQEAEPRQGAGK